LTEQQKEWYSPGEIRFNRFQCIFIIFHLESMSIGQYPSDFKVTGYSGKSKGGINKRAYFDNPCVFSAEVSRRLKLTKTAGKLLKAQIQGGITDYEELEPEAQMALDFISIFDFRKRPSYPQWRARHKYYYDKQFGYKKYPRLGAR